MNPDEIKGKIQASQFRRQAAWAENENKMFLEDAKKDALGRFFTVMKKYEITDTDMQELLEISVFLI